MADFKSFPGCVAHLVGAAHEPAGSLQRRTAGVLKDATRRDHRLFADHAIAAHLAYAPARIGDMPIARQQLHGGVATVFDDDMIGPEIAALFGVRLLVEKCRFDGNMDFARGLFVAVPGSPHRLHADIRCHRIGDEAAFMRLMVQPAEILFCYGNSRRPNNAGPQDDTRHGHPPLAVLLEITNGIIRDRNRE